ncbi:MAG: 4-hydroxy-tetrahydrodipicolinate reductase, partial [Ilumatobacteraceae bacterium]
MRVGVNGAAGRMGSTVCAAVEAADGLELAAAVDVGRSVGDRTVHSELRAFADAACDVVVDFTVVDAARVTLPWLAMHGIHAVVGTTGFTDDDLATVRSTFGDGPAHCLLAPNFAISAVLMARFAEIAAPFFDTAEIIEYHHDRK